MNKCSHVNKDNPKGEVRYTDNINFDQDIGDSKT
jgi:hypothetical protein